MPNAIARRHQAAVDALGLSGTENVLEIGCGQGIATRLILSRLTTGRLTAVDRSARMIDAVVSGSPEAVASGTLVTHVAPIEEVHLDTARFDRIVAVNVDFQLRLGDDWPAVLLPLLHGGGTLVISFEAPPGSGKGTAIIASARAAMERNGMRVAVHAADGVSVLTAQPA